MFISLILASSIDFIGPVEYEHEVVSEINYTEVAESIPEEVLTNIVSKVIENHPEIIEKLLDTNPKFVEKAIDNNPDIVLRHITIEFLSDMQKKSDKEEKTDENILDKQEETLNNNEESVEGSESAIPVESQPAFTEADSTDTYEFYLYTMEDCGPCKRMYDELVNRQSELPGKLYIGNFPAQFRSGFPVINYPSFEILKNGKTIKRFSGYTSLEYILKEIKE